MTHALFFTRPDGGRILVMTGTRQECERVVRVFSGMIEGRFSIEGRVIA